MTTIAVADTLKQQYIKRWDSLLNHKFIAEMGNNSLPLEKFIFYLKQDLIFLRGFCVFLLNAKQNAYHEPELKQWLDRLYHSTVNYEMQMQKELLSSLGISMIDDYCVCAATATTNYICFLRNLSRVGSLEEILSAMAPCPWSYLEIAQKLSRNDNIKIESYRKWAQFYSSKESEQQVEEIRHILGKTYLCAGKQVRKLMEKNFEAACKYEYEFWGMAYNQG